MTLVARLIESSRSVDPAGQLELQKLAAKREVEYIELAQDKDAFERFRVLVGES